MREIKFRIWDKLAERFIKCDEGYQGHYVLSLKGEFHNLQNGSGGDEYVVQQYTGLTDKNGVEIYEGDIIHYKFDGALYPKEACDLLLTCIYCPIFGGYNFNAPNDSYYYAEIRYYYAEIRSYDEVIGNIFENPELLEK